VKIRSITAFVDVTYPLTAGPVAKAGEALGAARRAFTEAGWDVQTVRLATQPYPDVLDEAGPGKTADLAKDLEALGFVHEIDYVSIGPARLTHSAAYIEALPEALGGTQTVFAGIEIAHPDAGIHLPTVRRAADVIRRVGALTDDGFTNLRLAALANVPAGAPFFPAAYHEGGPTRLAVATESADLILTAIDSAASLAEAHEVIVRAVEREAERVEAIMSKQGAAFGGIDFSPAPFPEEARSIGAALERLGLPGVGHHGTLAAVAFITHALGQAHFPRTGFCGVMLPVLEDPVLAARAAEGELGINELLLYSAVCGTGLDTLPLPGDIDEDAIAAILLDVGALALRLDKPLTARLMPLPGKKAGDAVAFDFDYFAPSRVLAPRAGALSGLFAGDDALAL
jgi:uncharacterized protein (UPF0210 family)